MWAGYLLSHKLKHYACGEVASKLFKLDGLCYGLMPSGT